MEDLKAVIADVSELSSQIHNQIENLDVCIKKSFEWKVLAGISRHLGKLLIT